MPTADYGAHGWPAGDLLTRGPAPWYFSGEDALQLNAFNTASGVLLTVAGRFRTLEGDVVPFAFTQTPTTDGLRTTTTFGLGEGWLLNAVVFVSAGTPTSSQCVILLRVQRGLTAAAQPLGTLAQGFVTTSQEATWPLTLASPGMASLATGATLRSIAGSDPAANTEFSQTVDAGKRWRVQLVRVTLVTDGTAASRRLVIIIDDGTNEFARIDSQFDAPATTTASYTFAPQGQYNVANNTRLLAPWPSDLILPPAARVRSSTSGLQAGDNYGAPQFLVEEWTN